MTIVDWSKAPEGAEFWCCGLFYKTLNGKCLYFAGASAGWVDSTSAKGELIESYVNFYENPNHIVDATKKVWPTESRIEQIGQNGGDGLHYDEQREVAEKMAAREVHLKQSAEQNRAPDSLGKYDRSIKGKYKTGTCTVDVYRVLSAFEITEPELQHCIKKLLAAGQRGAKDYNQDLREAAVSLCMLIDRLAE